MGTNGKSLSASQCLCEFCHRYSYPEQVAGNGGKCPFCGRALEDDGWARPVNLVGGRTVLGYEALAILAAKQQESERRAARAMGEMDDGKRDVLGMDDGSSKKRIYGSDGMESRDPPDFAPVKDDETLFDEIREADINDRVADIWEMDDDDVDEFGNPIVRGKHETGGDDADGDGDGESGSSGGSGGSGGGLGIPFVPEPDDDPEFAIPDEEDPFGSTAFEGMDERPGPDYDDDPDEMPEDPDMISTAAYDPAGTGMPQEVPEESRMLAMRAREEQAKRGVPTRAELQVLRGPYPSSMLKGFDRGPRPNLLSGPEGRPRKGPEGVPPHGGILRYLDQTKIDYPQDYNMAKRFV